MPVRGSEIMFLQVPFDPIGLDLFAGGLYCICWIIGFIIWIYLLFWIYKDAERRGSSGILWAVLFFFFSWIAIIIWIIVRGPIQPQGGVHHHYYAPPPAAGPVQYCPTCGQPMRWVQQYNRWYCNYCRGYK